MNSNSRLRTNTSFTLIAIAAATLIVGACDSTDVTNLPTVTRLTVTLDSVHGPTISGAPPTQTVQCSLDLHARFESPDDQPREAQWQQATRLIYIGGTRVDSMDISPLTVSATWGGTMSKGAFRSSTWNVSWTAPFTGAFVFYYLVPGKGAGSARVQFTCGTPLPGAVPPTITAFSFTPSTGDVEPGDSLHVSYAATSSIELWNSSIVLSGACDGEVTFDERGKKSLNRTEIVVLPAACRPGQTVSVGVVVTNLTFASDTAQAPSGPRVVDGTPPTVSVSFFSPFNHSPIPTIGTRTWFTDDTLFAYVEGRDNQSVTRLFWEVQPAGFIDSIVVPAGFASYAGLVTIRPQRAWAGTRQVLRFYVRDAAGHLSDTVRSPAAPDSLRIYPDTSYPAVTASLDQTVRAVVIDDARGVLYVLQGSQSQGRVLTMSLATLAITDTITTGFATDLDLSAGGDSLVLALGYASALGIIDLRAADPVMTTLPMPGLDSATERPSQLRVAANGKAIVLATGSGAASYNVWEVNLGTGASSVRADAGNGGNFGLGSVGRSPEGGAVVLQGDADRFQRYDASSDAFGPRMTATPARLLPSLDSAGRRVVVRTNVYDSSLAFVRAVDIPDGGFPVPSSVISTDGAILFYAIGNRHIIEADPDGGAILRRAPVAVIPSQLYVSRSGNWLVAVEAMTFSAVIAVLSR